MSTEYYYSLHIFQIMPRAKNQYIQEMKERFEVNVDRKMKSAVTPEETITLVDEQQNCANDIDVSARVSQEFLHLHFSRD